MTQNTVTDDNLPVEEASSLATVFVDGAQGLSVVNGVVKLNLFQVLQDLSTNQSPLKKSIVLRLAMPPETAVSIANFILQNTPEVADDAAADHSE